MKGLSIMSGRSCILWCSMIALFVFPAVPLAGDTKPRLRGLVLGIFNSGKISA